jgi:hypothetical protein
MTSTQVPMFRPAPNLGHGRTWHVFDRRLNGFMLVAPFPCSLMQAGVICEEASTKRHRLLEATWRSSSGASAVIASGHCAAIIEGVAMVAGRATHGRSRWAPCAPRPPDCTGTTRLRGGAG